MRAIICCAGDQRRWNNHLGVPKQLVPIDGVPLLVRTVAQLNARGITDIVVTGFDDRYLTAGVPVRAPSESILPGTGIGFSVGFWALGDRTLVLLGDVCFSEHAMAALISASETDMMWIGRKGSSGLKRYGEIFAVSIPAERQAAVRAAAARTFELFNRQAIQRMTGWELYAVLNGLPPTIVAPGPNWINVDDDTDDFDFPAEYDAWAAARQQRLSAAAQSEVRATADGDSAK
jgi:molybdopterin-guanine dinucleotide biosynthesis protein A